MPNLATNLQECIDEVIGALNKLKNSIGDESEKEVRKLSVPAFNPNQQSAPPVIPQPEVSFTELLQTLNSDKWPDAVNKHLICDHTNPEEKMIRGRGIVELMVSTDIENTKFLDFGCGEGFSAKVASEKNATMSIGYDVKTSASWEDSNNLKYTTDWNQVVENGPYDTILCFDVIDHSEQEKPLELFKKMKSVLSENGKIYLRTHPFTSRHANHFYHNINKAYIHLVFSPEELKIIDPEWGESQQFEYNVGYTRPLMTYQGMFDEAHLQNEHTREMKEEVEPFFLTPEIAKRIQAKTNMQEFPEFQMSLQFIDYILVHKK